MFQVKEEPLWLEEAFIALGRSEEDDYERILSHPDKFGATKEEIQELFAPYLAYRDAVLPELSAILEGNETLQFYRNIGGSPYEFLENAAPVLLNEKQPDSLLLWTPDTEKDLQQRFSALIRMTVIREEEWQKTDEEPAMSVGELTELLNKSEISAELRYQMLYLYLNQKEFLEALRKVSVPMVEVLKKHFGMIRDRFWQQREKVDVDMLLREGASGLKLTKEEQAPQFYLSVFRYNGLSYHNYKQPDGKPVHLITVGMYLQRLIEGRDKKKELSPGEVQAVCKALGDNSRYRILMLILANGKMYLQELAKEIGLTPATVSHHISALMEANLLQMEVSEQEKRAIYYGVNRKQLEQLGEFFTELSRLNQ